MNDDHQNYVFISISGEKSRVIEMLNQIASTNPEVWSKLKKRRKSDEYHGYGCYRVDFQANDSDVE